MNTAIKMTDEAAGRVGGYLIVWGNPQQRDLQGEYFTPETELALDWYNQRPMLYHHGLDGTMKAEVIGVIDTLKPDATGLWAEAQLDMRKRYVETVRKLINKGVLGWSSGSLPHLVEVADDGRIKKWPVIEGSATPAPAEPRKTDIHTIKSAYVELGLDPAQLGLETQSPGTETEPTSEEPAAKGAEVTAKADTSVEPIKAEETMNIRETLMKLLQVMMQAMPDFKPTEEQVNGIITAAETALAPQQQAMTTMTPDALATAAAPMVGKALLDFVNEQRTAQQASEAAIKTAAENFMKTARPVTNQLPGFTGGGLGNGDQQQRQLVITVKSEYGDASAADMALIYEIRNGKSKRGWNPGQKFFRELADKAAKAIEDGTLKYLPEPGDVDDDDGAPITSAVKAIAAIKSDELDYSTQAGYGDEWVPDLWRSEIWPRVRRDNVVASQFQIWDMPTNPWNVPLEAGDPTVYRVAETKHENQLTLADSNNPTPDSKIGTDKNQLFAYKLGLRVPLSSELEEDSKSILQVIPQFREQAMRAMLDAVDHVLLNADSTIAGSPSGNINRYDAATLVTDADKWLLGWDGMLHQPLIDNTSQKVDAGGAAPTLQMFRAVQSTLDEEYLDDTNNLVWIVDALTHQKMKGIQEFLTMDKFGTKATILTGQVGSLDGVPVLVSNQIKRADTNGKISNTPGNNIRGRAALIYKPYQVVGYRRRIKTWIKFYEETDSYQLGATVRIAFKRRDTTGSVGLLYNILV